MEIILTMWREEPCEISEHVVYGLKSIEDMLISAQTQQMRVLQACVCVCVCVCVCARLYVCVCMCVYDRERVCAETDTQTAIETHLSSKRKM